MLEFAEGIVEEAHSLPKLVPEVWGVSMRSLVLALLFSGLVLNIAHSAQSEGRRMLVFALYGASGTPGSAATTTVIDFTTQVACREARDELQSNTKLKAPGFRVFATCVEP
jgi:hypothetical protein